MLRIPLAEVVVDLGLIEITRSDVDDVLAKLGQIAIVIVLSLVVTTLAKRGIRRVVANVHDRDSGFVDRLRRQAQEAMGEEENEIAHLRRIRRTEALASVGGSVISATVWTLATFSILSTLGVELGPYIAGLGIIGVALGFGAQDLVKDFISGVFMLLEDQYGIGDVVDVGPASGTVEGISLRTTRVRSVNGTLWHVPNGEIRRLGNMSQDWARALLDVGVAYGTNTDDAARVIEEVASTMAHEPEYADRFLAEPEVWGVENLGPDAVDIRLVIKTTPGDQWKIAREIRRRVKHALDEAGIEIPYPQRTVWVRREDGGDPTAQDVADASAGGA